MWHMMSRYSGSEKKVRPSLIVAKGSFAPMGGAERDLLRIIPSLTKLFSVKIATLHSVPELENLCKDLEIELFAPKINWVLSKDVLSTILDTGIESAAKTWLTCDGLIKTIKKIDCIHIVVSVFSDTFQSMFHAIYIFLNHIGVCMKMFCIEISMENPRGVCG